MESATDHVDYRDLHLPRPTGAESEQVGVPDRMAIL